jgi:hypothetical protein
MKCSYSQISGEWSPWFLVFAETCLQRKPGAIPKSGDAILAADFIETDRFIPGVLWMLGSGTNILAANAAHNQP